ncbi:MAG: hypothetical protein OEZ28_11660, partial [Nitrospinota bacterium]|nr:hypothetical protein [Nitrospinota bacterium]
TDYDIGICLSPTENQLRYIKHLSRMTSFRVSSEDIENRAQARFLIEGMKKIEEMIFGTYLSK